MIALTYLFQPYFKNFSLFVIKSISENLFVSNYLESRIPTNELISV